MFNTYWALGNEGYYRVDDGKLLYAPINNIDYSVSEKIIL